MNKTFFKAMAVSAAAMAAMTSTAAHADTAEATATAEILQQVTVESDGSALNFGTIVVGDTGGDVVISAAGALSACDANLVCSGTVSAAGFDVTGTTGETVDITVDSNVTLTNNDGDTMIAALAGSDATLVLAGGDSFAVGGTLTVGDSQADGQYSGTFEVTVDYQ
ncbi:MAG: DUF4402 domain-containing protein [Pseudomonadota bacterium]